MTVLADLPSLAALLPYHSYDAEGRVFVQDDGSLGIAWRLGVVPCDAASDVQLEALAHRVEEIIRILPEGWAAQVILVLSRNAETALARWSGATSAPAGSILADLTQSRCKAVRELSLTHQGAPFVAKTLEAFFTLRSFPRWPAEGLLDFVRPKRLDSRLRESYLKAKKEILEVASAVENALPQAAIPFSRLDEESLVRLLHRLLNPDRSAVAPPPPARADRLLRERVALSHLDFDFAGGTIAMGGAHLRLLSAIELPVVTGAGMLSLGTPAVMDLLPDSIIAFNIEIPLQEKVKESLGRKKRLAFWQLGAGDVKVDMAAMKEEVDQALGEVFLGGRVVSARIHLAIADRDLATVEARCRAVAGAMSRAGLQVVEERSLALPLFLQSLPLAYDPANDRMLKRGRTMMARNLAHLLPLYGTFQGTPTPDLLLMNRRGEPVNFSFFDSNVAPHGIVAGISGSGKSVFANNAILSVLRRGARVFVLDRGNSYRKLARVLGGEYVELHPDRPRSLGPCGTAGPAGSELSREKLVFLRDLIAEMATRGTADLAPREQSLVEMAIATAFRAKPGQEVFISDIQAALLGLASQEREARGLALCLSSFVKDGPYGAFFDRPCGISFEKPLVVFELGETALEKSVVSVLLMAMIQRITESCTRPGSGDKYVLIDEAWTLLRSRATARFLENIFRTYRKYRTAAVMLTQQVADFEGPAGEAIRANAPNRIYLRQTPEGILAMERLLDLSVEEKRLLGSLTTQKGRFSEFLVVTPEVRGVARLVQDPLSYWITTSDPADNARLEELVAKHRSAGGADPLAAALREAAALEPGGHRR